MLIDNINGDVKRIAVGSNNALMLAKGSNPLWLNSDRRAISPLLRQNSDGTGATTVGSSVGYAKDLSPNGLHAIMSGANRPTIVQSGDESYLSFNGSSSYLTIPYSPVMDMIASFPGLTVECWLRSHGSTWNSIGSLVSREDQFVVGPQNTTAHTSPVLMMLMNEVSDAEGGPPTGYQPGYYGAADWGQSSLDITVWNHVAFTYTTAEMRCIINGVEVFNAPLQSNLGPPWPSTLPIHVGHNNIAAVGSQHLGMDISDLRLWYVARNNADITANMNKRLKGDEDYLLAYYPL